MPALLLFRWGGGGHFAYSPLDRCLFIFPSRQYKPFGGQSTVRSEFYEEILAYVGLKTATLHGCGLQGEEAPPGRRTPQPLGRGPVAPQEVTTGTQGDRLSYLLFFPNPDSVYFTTANSLSMI